MSNEYFPDTLYQTRPTESLICFFGSLPKKYGGINFAQGIPGFDPPKELLDILSELVYDNYHQYAPGQGNPNLLHQLTNYYKPFIPDISEENILIVQGATEAGSLIYNYLSKEIGEPFSALAFDPVYETYSHLPGIYNSGFVAFPSSPKGIDFKALETTIMENNVRIVFLNSPGNPLGSLISKEEYKNLIALSQKYKIYILMDAVYKDLYFEKAPYIPVEHAGEYLFYIDSFSKMLSITGWRIGYFITSTTHMKKIKQIHDYTGLCAPALFQEAIAQYLEKYNFGKEYLSAVRALLKKTFNTLKNFLISKGFIIPDIKGGYFIWARIPDVLPDGYTLALNLYREQQIGVVPGAHFSNEGDRYLRFNIARKPEEIELAIHKLNLFLKNHGL
jgi:aspartate/methionine/tyrosine aminotransferase